MSFTSRYVNSVATSLEGMLSTVHGSVACLPDFLLFFLPSCFPLSLSATQSKDEHRTDSQMPNQCIDLI